MVNYKCFRCGYETKFKSSFRDHLNRKNICNPILDNICVEEIKKWYNIDVSKNIEKVEPVFEQVKPVFLEKKIICEFCDKTFTRTYGLTCHLKKCKKKKLVETELLEKNNEIQNLNETNKIMEKEISELKKYIDKIENVVEDLSYDLKECINLNKKLRKENRKK
jgi:hypothetical protein